MDVKFECACCGHETVRQTDDEEIMAEFKRVFGEDAEGSLLSVCDDCYDILTDPEPMAKVERLVHEITGQDIN